MNPGEHRFYLYSLGCPKNLVDSEWLSGRLMAAGWEATTEPSEAEVILINTCSFVEPAVRESIDAILTLRGSAPHARLIVTGCLPLRYGKVLINLLPEVNLFFLSRCMERVDDATIEAIVSGRGWVGFPCGTGEREDPGRRTISTPFYTAYVKIADGCNRRCAYCTLPAIRGRYRSRPQDAIAGEVEDLAARGVREIILVAQDTAAYGVDLDKNVTLGNLLERLSRIAGLSWIKLLYLYPDVRRVDRGLVEVMARSPVICPVVDIPIQHISAPVLKRMRRPGPDAIRKVLKRFRSVPGFTLRTTIMVGFPGEAEEDFRHLCDFIEEGWFDNLGVFTYSDEEGTFAYSLPDKVPEDEKVRRKEALMEIQQRVSLEKNREREGTVLPVLAEGPHEETDLLLRGRTAFQFPEIDGCVIITRGTAEIGEIVPVRITDAGAYDLVGEMVE